MILVYRTGQERQTNDRKRRVRREKKKMESVRMQREM